MKPSHLMLALAAAAVAGPAVAQSAPSPITPAQHDKIMAALDSAPPSLRRDVDQARGTIGAYVEADSCVTDPFYGASGLRPYLGPDALGLNQIVAPLVGMGHHDRGSCLDVLRFQGWRRVALNEISFQAVYLAADSGESAIREHVVHRQPDGAWLMKQ